MDIQGSSEPGKSITSSKKYQLISIGFLGWYLINGLIWFFLLSPPGYMGVILLFLIFPVNLLTPIVLAANKRTRMIALGIVAALGINFLISLFNGWFMNGICFVPFYFRSIFGY